VAPFVHDEQALRGELGKPCRRASVVAQRFLAVDGNAHLERLLDDGGMRARRRGDDNPVDTGERRDVSDELPCPALLCPGPALLRASDDQNLAPERDQVTEDVLPPPPAADEAR